MVIGGFLGCLAIGVLARVGSLEYAFVPPAAAVLAWLLTKPYGAIAVIGPVFLFPYGYGPIPWAIAMLTLATAWWFLGAGRPRLPSWGLCSVGVVGLVFFAQALLNSYDMLDAVNVPLLWFAGVIVGVGLAHNERALLAVGTFCVPLALLALWEVSGGTNYWAEAVGSAKLFGDLGSVEGAGRALSTLGHPLIAGNTLAVMAALVLGGGESRWRAPIVIVLTIGVVATVSRSSMLGLATGVAVFAALQSWRRFGWTMLAVGIAALAVWGLISVTPALRASFDSRLESRSSGQTVREYGRDRLWEAIKNPQDHIVGGGFRESIRFMDQRGGISGFSIFDNWYPTAIYDIGWGPLVAALLLAAIGWTKADPRARRAALPALAVVAVVVFFMDGVYWFSWRVTSGMVLGALLAPALAKPSTP